MTMRLDEEQESGNIEDRRGFRVSPGVAGGGIGTIVLVLIALFFGVDPSAILQGTPQSNVSEPAPAQTGARDEGREFVARILGSTERTWGEVFERGGRQYVQPKLVLFSGAAQSACGFAQAAAGPFYCPNDQNLLGIMGKVQARQARSSEREANALSVRLELQADCLAGIWANFANRERHILGPGDVEEGLNAAAQIGDDTLQKRAQGYVVPEGFTHGSAEQRVGWFRRGIESGDLKRCDTFGAGSV